MTKILGIRFFITIFILAYGLFAILKIFLHPVLALYVALAPSVLAIIYAESIFSYRSTWKPKLKDFGIDIRFTIFNHVLLDRGLKMAAVMVFPTAVFDVTGGMSVIMQTCLMLVLAEFSRYWLHRLLHTNKYLWRFHRVHHSSQKLHASNVVWVHPVDKIMQFVADTLPFIVLGISDEALLLYFIFYTIHGFFQHSNLAIELGFFNKIFSGPELHRWHHDVDLVTANHNFGNNLILWDLIFGTYYNPKHKEVRDVGVSENIKNKKNIAIRVFDYVVTSIISKIRWRIYAFACYDPKKSQSIALKKIIHLNRKTDFAKFCGLNNIKNIDDFRKRIPPQEYHTLSPFIDQQDQSTKSVITHSKPGYFASTSGTTGSMKLIPVTPDYVKQLRIHQVLTARMISKSYPRAMKGKLFIVSSPSIEGHTKANTPYGAISGFMQENLPGFLKKKYIGNHSIFGIENYSKRYLALALLTLTNQDTTLWAAANPSTFLKIIETIRDNQFLLRDAFKHGHIKTWDLPKDAEVYLNRCLSDTSSYDIEPHLSLAVEGQVFDSLWPNLELIVTWTGGSCGVAIDRLKKYFRNPPGIMDLGYVASEARITLPLGHQEGGIPTLREIFYEFVEKEKWERKEQDFLLLNELEPHRQYYIFLTTTYGLYRYNINDIVEVVGFYKKTPLLKFIQKGIGVTNITGEKVYEGQMLNALRQVAKDYKCTTRFFIAVANAQDARYELYLEGSVSLPEQYIAKTIDDILCQLNIEYKSKRESGRLGSLVVKKLSIGTGEQYKEYLVKSGQRESQFKYMTLVRRETLGFDFQPHYLSEA